MLQLPRALRGDRRLGASLFRGSFRHGSADARGRGLSAQARARGVFERRGADLSWVWRHAEVCHFRHVELHKGRLVSVSLRSHFLCLNSQCGTRQRRSKLLAAQVASVFRQRSGSLASNTHLRVRLPRFGFVWFVRLCSSVVWLVRCVGF